MMSFIDELRGIKDSIPSIQSLQKDFSVQFDNAIDSEIDKIYTEIKNDIKQKVLSTQNNCVKNIITGNKCIDELRSVDDSNTWAKYMYQKETLLKKAPFCYFDMFANCIIAKQKFVDIREISKTKNILTGTTHYQFKVNILPIGQFVLKKLEEKAIVDSIDIKPYINLTKAYKDTISLEDNQIYYADAKKGCCIPEEDLRKNIDLVVNYQIKY